VKRVPHHITIIAFCIAAITGYALLSAWAILVGAEAAIKGDVIGTWKSFAVGAFGFWLGSSSGGKARDAPPPADAKSPLDLTGAEIPQPGGTS